MANEFIYSPNSRLTKFRRACNQNTKFHARGNKWGGCSFLCIESSLNSDVGQMYYDTDSNTSAGFIFVTKYDYYAQVQDFKQTCFSSCIRLFRIRTWTYYRVDATGLLHGNNTGRTEEEEYHDRRP